MLAQRGIARLVSLAGMDRLSKNYSEPETEAYPEVTSRKQTIRPLDPYRDKRHTGGPRQNSGSPPIGCPLSRRYAGSLRKHNKAVSRRQDGSSHGQRCLQSSIGIVSDDVSHGSQQSHPGSSENPLVTQPPASQSHANWKCHQKHERI